MIAMMGGFLYTFVVDISLDGFFSTLPLFFCWIWWFGFLLDWGTIYGGWLLLFLFVFVGWVYSFSTWIYGCNFMLLFFFSALGFRIHGGWMQWLAGIALFFRIWDHLVLVYSTIYCYTSFLGISWQNKYCEVFN